MISKRTRVRLLAVLCGPVLGFATGLALTLSTAITLRLLPHTEASIWEPVSYVMAWIPVTLLIAGLAAVYGEYDLLVIVTCAIPALIFFAGNYAMSISAFLPDDGHTFHDIIGVYPPFDFADQSLYLGKLLLWAMSAAVAAIALKRAVLKARRSEPPVVLTRTEDSGLWPWMALDLGLIVLVICAILFIDLRDRLRLGSPEFLTANLVKALESSASTPGEREDALNKLTQYSDKFDPAAIANATTMLHRELQSQPSPINLEPAEILILFHDDAGVPLLENALAHASQPGAVAPPSGWAGVISRLEMAKAPLTAKALVPLLSSPDSATREEAAHALRSAMSLRQEHMSRFVPGWDPATDVEGVTKAMIVALGDSDERVRYFAVCTLTEININPHYPGIRLFEENEEAYVAGWKAWAKQRAQVAP